MIASNGHGTAFGLADHAEQSGLLQHLPGVFVHARRGGGAGRSDRFVAHRVDRANVVDEAIGEVHRKLLAAIEHIGHALVRGVASGQQHCR